jgi:hypothetical protein
MPDHSRKSHSTERWLLPVLEQGENCGMPGNIFRAWVLLTVQPTSGTPDATE